MSLNKVVIITGAASGIGKGIAIHFAKLSASLSLIDINADNLREVVAECENLSKAKVLQIVADVSKDEEIKQAVAQTVQEHGRIDVLVNCAGMIGYRGILDSHLMSTFDTVLSVNVRAMVAMTHYAAPALIESKGCVVNIASVMAGMVSKDSIPYCVSKAAAAHFTRCVALDLADKGVRVNSILPGPVKTNILIAAGDTPEGSDKTWEFYAKSVPLSQLIEVNEIAEMVSYLASDKAKSITGADFVIDAGLMLSGISKEYCIDDM